MHGLCDDRGEGLIKARGGGWPELPLQQGQVGMLRGGAGLQVRPAALSLTALARGRGEEGLSSGSVRWATQ